MVEPVDYGESYTRYQLSRGGLRRLIRSAYLRRASSLVRGATLDLGCGIGDLLTMLPSGSQGLEYNKSAVEYCRGLGLAVDYYDAFEDDWLLSKFTSNDGFQSLVISHVLEHLVNPVDVLQKLLVSATRIGIGRVLVIVPGWKGYLADDTHRVFVTAEMLIDACRNTAYSVKLVRHFPFNFPALGKFMRHHELQVVFDRRDLALD